VPSREVANDVLIKRFQSLKFDGAFHFAPQLVPAIRDTDVDIIHAHNYHSFPLLFAAVGAVDERFVITTHYHAQSQGRIRDVLLSLYQPLGQWAVRQADSIVAVSEWERDKLLHDFGITATIIPNGITTSRFNGIDTTDRARPYLLTVGRLEEYKGVQHIIRAMKSLPAYDLLIAGSGSYREHLEQVAIDENVADQVVFLGYVEDDILPSLYANAEVYVTMSEAEAYGMTVAEALTAGTPAVVLRKSGLTEWQSKPGVIGIDSVSPDAIRKAIITSKEIVVQWSPPTWDEVTSSVEEIYDSTLPNQSNS
jgi:glycosyltransferase involved in cell wall biosynthesis